MKDHYYNFFVPYEYTWTYQHMNIPTKTLHDFANIPTVLG